MFIILIIVLELVGYAVNNVEENTVVFRLVLDKVKNEEVSLFIFF